MNVELPGTGIGGLFYLLTALLMPVPEVWHTVRGRSTLRRWRRVATQTGLALGILAGLWMTALVLQWCLPTPAISSLRHANRQAAHALGVTPTWLTVLTLAGVLVGVEGLHLVLRWSSRRR